MQKSRHQPRKDLHEQLARLIDRFLPIAAETMSAWKSEEDCLTELLQMALDPFGTKSGDVWGTIHLVNASRTKLQLKACYGDLPPDEQAECDLQDDKCVISSVARGRQSIHVADFDKSSEFPARQSKRIRCQFSVPVDLKGETIGVLSLQSSKPKFLRSSDVDYFTRVASFAALIVERSDNCQIAQERGYYLNALYALKKKELLRNPVKRTAEDIRKLVESKETMRQLIEEMAKDA
jgi:putative methionine-R-sulfoxide reductase with GAF domain